MTNMLKKIIQEKKETLEIIKKNNSLNSLENKIKNIDTFLNFPTLIACLYLGEIKSFFENITRH